MNLEYRKPSNEAFNELDKCASSIGSAISHFKKYEEMCINEGLDDEELNFHAKRRLEENDVPYRTSVYLRKDVTARITGKRLTDKHENTPELPIGAFDAVLADPPWDYGNEIRGAALNHYETMENSELAKLPIPFADNCVLFMWATQPKIREALELMQLWEFEYTAGAVWVKDKFGTGFYFRSQHELLLLGIKGKMPPPEQDDRLSSVINAPRTEHSKKPDVVYEIIERMYPNREYLELFARRRFSNKWAVWGKEVA